MRIRPQSIDTERNDGAGLISTAALIVNSNRLPLISRRVTNESICVGRTPKVFHRPKVDTPAESRREASVVGVQAGYIRFPSRSFEQVQK
jgi:hypothetical protein